MTKYPTISSYFSKSAYEEDKNFITSKGPLYIGHELMLKESINAIPIKHLNEEYLLIQNDSKINLVSNICLHRQVKIINSPKKCKNLVCPLHLWNYKLNGKLISTPHFQNKDFNKDNFNLEVLPVYNLNGLLFKNRIPEIDFDKLELNEYINFTNYFYHSTQSTSYNFNWKTFLEIYLENYHVFSMHPGLKTYVNPSDLTWHFGDDYSVQKVGMGSNLLTSKSQNYQNWQKLLLNNYPNNSLPKYGAIWILIYPNIMIEWYPNILILSTVYPIGSNSCINHVEFFYDQKLYKENEEYFKLHNLSYNETAIEDNEACLLLESGRRSLYINSKEQNGPIDTFLETGVDKFYNYLSCS